jgi:hypothetical protein
MLALPSSNLKQLIMPELEHIRCHREQILMDAHSSLEHVMGDPARCHIRKKKAASWNSAHSSRVDLATSCIGRLPCPHSVEVSSSLSSLLAYRPPLRSRSRKAMRAAGPRAAWHQQMTPAAGPLMALSQIPAQPQPATPAVRPTIALALLPDRNRPEARNLLRQRRLRRSSNLLPSARDCPCKPVHPWLASTDC